MKKHVLLPFFSVVLSGIISLAACKTPEPRKSELPKTSPMKTSIKITVGQNEFTAELVDNPTTIAFIKLLPLTLDMQELNNNEKYVRLDQALPTRASVPQSIRTGDLMLYGDQTLVLFYRPFTTAYTYTPLGKIINPVKLEQALGSGNASVKFEII